ncbi:hypothetical protein [Dorea sp. AF36-15AT]|uniref:hypothetical protein n=1 Tax=Dorea sp. AF36-15AT TaxID=2292041 RepID=UPI001FAA4832|nr:hypothetical protein [Dorea sp. AF36-15AT]
MKRTGIGIWLLAAVVLISGCGKRADNGKGINSGETVDKVIESQVKKEEQKKTEESTKEDTQKNNQQNTDTQTPESVQGTVNAPEAAVDVDLSVMDSDMIYATVYQMMSDPEQYVGKTFRIEGKFYVTYDEMTKNQYYYCVIKDATECCAQGLEFVWGDGSHIYPDEYPTDGTEVIVDGTFELYMENDSRYCRLENADFYF